MRLDGKLKGRSACASRAIYRQAGDRPCRQPPRRHRRLQHEATAAVSPITTMRYCHWLPAEDSSSDRLHTTERQADTRHTRFPTNAASLGAGERTLRSFSGQRHRGVPLPSMPTGCRAPRGLLEARARAVPHHCRVRTPQGSPAGDPPEEHSFPRNQPANRREPMRRIWRRYRLVGPRPDEVESERDERRPSPFSARPRLRKSRSGAAFLPTRSFCVADIPPEGVGKTKGTFEVSAY